MDSSEYSEILVSNLDASQVLERITAATVIEDNSPIAVPQTGSSYLFNGRIKDNSFYISERMSRADSFLPLIEGRLERTRNGCILFLDYRFFPSTLFFLGFWSVVTVLLTVFFLLVQPNLLFALLSFSFGAINYLFVRSHFKRKVKRSQRLLHQMLDVQLKD